MRAPEPWDGCAGGSLDLDEARDAWQYAAEDDPRRPDAFDLLGLGGAA